jgi:similar to stage IV sporulation protein
MGDLLLRLLGYARVRIEGAEERLFRRALGHGVALRRITWRRGALEAEVPLDALPVLEDEARTLGAAMRVLARGGLPVWLAALGRRPVFVAAGLAAAAVYVALSLFVWQVRVVGVEGGEAERVRALAAAMGLRPGAVRALVPVDEIRQALGRLPGHLYAGVRFYGVDAYIEVAKVPAEAELPPPAAAGDLVARMAGLVTRVVVFRGRAAVAAGDTVVPGQVLIAGEEGTSEPAAEAGQPVVLQPVAADGVVFARVFLTLSGEAALVGERFTPTGRSTLRLYCAVDGRRATVALGRARYAYSERVERPLLLPLLPVSCGVEQIRELRRVVWRRPEAAVRASLLADLVKRAQAELGSDARWLNRRESFKIRGTKLVGQLNLEAEAQIATPQGTWERSQRQGR